MLKPTRSSRFVLPADLARGRPGIGVPFLLASVVFLVWTTQFSYLVFHTLVELFSIGVALLVGVVAWYAYPLSRNNFLVFLGLALPGIAAIDLAHTFAYKGMNILLVDDTNLPTQLWVAARCFQALVLLIAPAFVNRSLRADWLAAGVAVVTFTLLGMVFTGNFPDAHVEGVGLTTFKIVSEYVIVALLAGALGHLWLYREALDPPLFRLMAVAILVTMVSELAFTFYVDVYGLSNLVGHIFKLLAFALIFRAIVVRGLEEPFRLLSRDVSTYNAIPQPVVVVDRERRVRQANEAATQFAGGEPIGADCHQRYHSRAALPEDCQVCQRIVAGESAHDIELYLPDNDKWMSVTLTPLAWRGETRALVQVMHDITQRKHGELELLAVNRALITVSASNHALVYSRDEESLLTAICDTIVNKGGYLLAWVGFVEHDAAQSLRPVKSAGKECSYLNEARFSWGDTPLGQAPAGVAVRTGRASLANDMSAPELAPWSEAATRHGLTASLAFPLKAPDRPIFGVLVLYSERRNAFSDSEVALLSELADDLGYGLDALRSAADRDAAERRAAESMARLSRSLRETVDALAFTIEKRDPYTAGHQRRVADLATRIGQRLGLPEPQLEAIAMGALIHDIGKIYIPAEILNRSGRLSDREMDLIRTHPEVGNEIMGGVEFPWPVAPIIMQHHERYDGSGYPKHLKGDQIALEARIVAVADVMEAMASHRPYRASLGVEAALEEIRKNVGTLFDEDVVAACEYLFLHEGYRFPGEASSPLLRSRGAERSPSR